MSQIHDDTPVPEACYTPEVVRGLAEFCGRKDLSALDEELESHLSEVCLEVPTSVLATRNWLRVPPRRIALCGGGVRGVAHIGVLKVLQAEGLLGCVREIVGISAGSLFGLLVCCGYSLADAERLALQFDFGKLRTLDIDSVLKFPTTYGLDSGDGLEKFITAILKHQGLSPEITFRELAACRPIRLRCFATELQTARGREFSVQTTPDVPVRIGIRASMSLPILYVPVPDFQSDSAALLMDGGLLNNLPLAFLTPEEIRDTWAVLFTTKPEGEAQKITDIWDVARYIYDAAFLMKTKPFLEYYSDHIICVPTHDFSSVNFEITSEQRSALIARAAEEARKFLKAGTSRPPTRRMSIS